MQKLETVKLTLSIIITTPSLKLRKCIKPRKKSVKMGIHHQLTIWLNFQQVSICQSVPPHSSHLLHYTILLLPPPLKPTETPQLSATFSHLYLYTSSYKVFLQAPENSTQPLETFRNFQQVCIQSFRGPLTLTLYIRHPPWDPYHTPKSNSTQNRYHLHHHQHVHHLHHQHVHHLNQAVPHHRQQHYQLVYLQFVLSAKKSPIIATTTNKISFLPMIFFIIANYICQNEFCQNCQ